MDFTKKIGKKIQKIRKERHITQVQLAKILNCSPMTISNIECGNTKANTLFIERFAKAMNCKPFIIFENEDE